jgi:hypothetical protein
MNENLDLDLGLEYFGDQIMEGVNQTLIWRVNRDGNLAH